jgi:hypothetical protein
VSNDTSIDLACHRLSCRVVLLVIPWPWGLFFVFAGGFFFCFLSSLRRYLSRLLAPTVLSIFFCAVFFFLIFLSPVFGCCAFWFSLVLIYFLLHYVVACIRLYSLLKSCYCFFCSHCLTLFLFVSLWISFFLASSSPYRVLRLRLAVLACCDFCRTHSCLGGAFLGLLSLFPFFFP